MGGPRRTLVHPVGELTAWEGAVSSRNLVGFCVGSVDSSGPVKLSGHPSLRRVEGRVSRLGICDGPSARRGLVRRSSRVAPQSARKYRIGSQAAGGVC